MAENPVDDLAVQLPGRMLALEVLFTLLLRRVAVASAKSVLREAADVIDQIESDITKEKSSDYQLAMFEAARESVQKIAREALPTDG
jgi:dsDNA-specific endonuclease/ATPase MutS2